MGLSIGIIGLPNVGKSSTFNALCKAQHAEVANYPFCTIQPNIAIVPVPDRRVEKLVELVKVNRAVHATIEFFDIAGLVKGASQGEGLGNQFLANIRETSAILHIVRCFEDINVAHVSEELDPRNDIEVVNLELVLADMQTVERKMERLSGALKGDKKLLPTMQMAQALHEHLAGGKPASQFPDHISEVYLELDHELRLVTNKPQIYVANVDEDSLHEDNPYLKIVRQVASEHKVEVVKICAKLEQELIDMPEDERQEYLQLAGAEHSGLEQIIRKGYALLGLISFFTMNEEEVRAWTVPQGTTAPKAAGVIHTDFERGFIRAEVIPYDVFVKFGSGAAVRAAGQMHLEGKEYLVRDGDVIYFRFNV
jgi:GTP-binding protein YchF